MSAANSGLFILSNIFFFIRPAMNGGLNVLALPYEVMDLSGVEY